MSCLSKMGSERKLRDFKQIAAIAQKLRDSNRVVGFTNGCFDILHAGHVSYLQKARDMVDALIVGVNSDASIARIKGPKRPINRCEDRVAVLCALESVDYVVVFEEDTPENLIRVVKPDLLIKGADWAAKEVAGCEFVRSYGGRCEFIELKEGISTSIIIERIKNAYC